MDRWLAQLKLAKRECEVISCHHLPNIWAIFDSNQNLTLAHSVSILLYNAYDQTCSAFYTVVLVQFKCVRLSAALERNSSRRCAPKVVVEKNGFPRAPLLWHAICFSTEDSKWSEVAVLWESWTKRPLDNTVSSVKRERAKRAMFVKRKNVSWAKMCITNCKV